MGHAGTVPGRGLARRLPPGLLVLALISAAAAASAEPAASAPPPAPPAAPVPAGCWEAARAEKLERALDAFFAEKDAAKRSEFFKKDLDPQGVALTLDELEAMALAAPPQGAKKGEVWRVPAPWAKDQPRAWFNVAIPKGYSPAKAWGLVMVLHSGPAGHDGSNLVPIYSPAVNNAGCFALYPTILDEKHWWGEPGEVAWVYRVLEWAARRYRLDFRHLVVTGGSAGGIGTWNHLALHPEVWSAGASGAAMPGAGPRDFPKFKDVPFYLVQGDQDPFIAHVRAAVEGLARIGARHQYKEIAGAGHSLPPEAWRELAAWVPRQEPKPYSPRPLILPPPGERTLWQRVADPLNVLADPAMALLKDGKFAEARKALDERIARRPGQAKDLMMRALARLPALTKPLPAGLDAKQMADGTDGWGAATEGDVLRDLDAALRCTEGKGEDPAGFESKVHLLAAKILARRFVKDLSAGGYGWVQPFNSCGAEIRAAVQLDPSNAEAVELSQAIAAKLPRNLVPQKR